DQGVLQKGRIRYLNLSQAPAEVAGIVIAPGNIETVAGSGLDSPFDGRLATSAALNRPTGAARDPQKKLWNPHKPSGKIRFANCGVTPYTILPGTVSEQTVAAGSIATVNNAVGSGQSDGVPVNQSSFDTPQGLWATAEGIYVADSKKGAAVNQRRT